MKICIVGSRDCTSLEVLKEAITQADEAGITVSAVVTGEDKGICQIVKEWAQSQGIPVTTVPTLWSDISVDGAVIKERFNSWKKKKEPYNANAGKDRDKKLVEYAEGCISIDMGTGHSKWVLNSFKKEGKLVHEYAVPKMEDDLEHYTF